jgi:O-antigen ligase
MPVSSSAPTFAYESRFASLREAAFDVQRWPAWLRRAAAFAALLAIGGFWGVAVGLAGTSAAIICFSLIACVFCLRDFRAGVALLIVAMPIAQSYAFPHEMFGITGLNPLNLLLATTMLAFFMRRAGERNAPRIVPWQVVWLFLAPVTAAALIGMGHVKEIPSIFRELDLIFFSDAAGYLRDVWAKPLTFVIYSILVAAAVSRSDRPERFIAPMIVSVFVMAALAIVFVALSGVSLSQLAGTYARQFLSALGMHANDLGRLYATAYALLLFTWDRTDRIGLKTLLVFAMGVVVIALALTFSRGAFFGFILVNLIYLFARRRVKTLLMAAAVVPVGLYFMPGAFWYRITMGFGASMNELTAGRTGDIWEPILPELFNSPVWGSGLGSIMWSRAMIDGRLWQVSHPHNAYLQAFMDGGAIGLVLLLAFWIWAWRSFRRESRNASHPVELRGFFEGAAAGLLAFLIAGMAGSSLRADAAQAFLWLALGVLIGTRAKQRAAKPAKGK